MATVTIARGKVVNSSQTKSKLKSIHLDKENKDHFTKNALQNNMKVHSLPAYN